MDRDEWGELVSMFVWGFVIGGGLMVVVLGLVVGVVWVVF